MVEKLVKILKNKNIFILDIGTGSGCILISLLSELKKFKRNWNRYFKKSNFVAKKNVKKHKIENKIKFLNKSFTQLFNKKFDLNCFKSTII